MSSRLCAVSDTPTRGDGADIILPCQYYDLSGGDRLSGEQRLMFALLVDALNVFQRGATSPDAQVRRLYVDAERWIMTPRAAGGALSFDTVCDAVSIDPGLLRRRLLEWKQTLRRRHASQSRLRLSITPRTRHSRDRGRRPSAGVGARL